jgi:hypothetical protein
MPKLVKKQVTKNLRVNVVYGAEQEEYNNLPAHKTTTGIVAFAFELSDEEVKQVVANKKVYVSLLTFNQPLQPVFLTTSEDAFEDHIIANHNYYSEIMKLKSNKGETQ